MQQQSGGKRRRTAYLWMKRATFKNKKRCIKNLEDYKTTMQSVNKQQDCRIRDIYHTIHAVYGSRLEIRTILCETH